ncbi:MAG: YtoQ family protein, partial [Pseudomonadota bacterium]
MNQAPSIVPGWQGCAAALGSKEKADGSSHFGSHLKDGTMFEVHKSSAVDTWRIYLSGEIHTDWREKVEVAAFEAALPVAFFAPVTDHAASD